MLKHYFQTALSNVLRYRLFAAIILFGLAVGLACTLLIGLFVSDELSFDRRLPDAERIYRISRDFPVDNLYFAANAPLSRMSPSSVGSVASRTTSI